MPERSLPVRPDLDQLKRQAKELLRDLRKGDPAALAEFAESHLEKIDPAAAKLADAQLVLARAHGATGWPRLMQSCRIVDAIWKDDLAALRELVTQSPNLIHEHALVRPPGKISNWGPPMTYAANLGRDRIIELLRGMGATDLERAIDRAVLQGRIGTAKMLHAMMGSPTLPTDALGSPAYTLSASGTAFLFEVGARAVDDQGRRLAPVEVVLGSDSRKPEAKHAILEMYVQHGLSLPDTAPMALHRGRIDLLERLLAKEPGLLDRRFTFAEIYPPELGCDGDQVQMTHGTSLEGAALLHMCCDYDELEIAKWLIAKGADVNARAAVDAEGFGGHTPLFATVVSQPNFWMNHNNGSKVAPFAELLLENGADPNVRASLRKQMHPGYGPDTLREYRDVTPLSWGRRFHFRKIVSDPAMKLIEAAGGWE